MDYKLNAISELVQNIHVQSESLLFHPTLNVIIVSSKDGSVHVINPETGLVLHKSDLSATKGNNLQWKYIPGSDKIVVTDGYRFGCRSNHDGIILLDTILQKPVNGQKEIIKLEILNTEAITFLNAIETCNLTGFEDLKRILKEGIDNQKIANGVKEQKWATVCLKLPLATLMKSTLTLLVTLLPRKPANPALPLLSSILEQISEMCEGYDPVKLTKASRMGVESRRRATFDNWPHKNYKWAFPEQMAKAGFYHEPDKTGDDRAFCFTCSICLISWELMDEPWTEHERHSPSCPFILGDFTTNVPISVTNSTSVAYDIEANPVTKHSFISKIGSSAIIDLIPAISQSKNEVIIFDINSGIQLFYSICADNIFYFESMVNRQKFIISNVCLLRKMEPDNKDTIPIGMLISIENSKNLYMFNTKKKNITCTLEKFTQQLLKPTQKIELLNKSKLDLDFDVMDFLPLADSQEVLIVLKSSEMSDQYGGVINLYPVQHREDNLELKDQPNRRYLLPCETPLNTVLIPNSYLDDGSPHNGFYATVCVDGNVRIYDLDSFSTLLELSINGTEIVSATFCQSIERLCCATNDGFLHFFKLVALSDSSDLLMDSMEKERIEFIKELHYINSKTIFETSRLRKLYSLCEYEPLKCLDLDRRAFSAIAPNNWTEVIQPTLQHKQYPILEIMSSIMWKYVPNGNSFHRNNRHIFELNLLQATYLSHIDLRLNLNENIRNYNVEISLLSLVKQKSPITDDEVVSYNVECGPIIVNHYIDEITHAADVTLTCPNLIKSRSRTLFIEIKISFNDQNQEECFDVTRMNWPLTTFSSSNPEEDETPIKEKYNYSTTKPFPIDCISISFQSQKQGTQTDSDQTIRSIMLESNDFLESLVYNIFNNNENIVSESRSLIAFDVLLWVAMKRLTRRCSEKVPIDQQECFEIIISYIPLLLKHCLFFGDRSLAHKCTKFFHMVYLCTKHLDVDSFSSITYKTLSDMLDDIDKIESCGSLHWFTVLLMNFIPKFYAEEITERCLELLKKIAVLLNAKKTPYDTFLRSKFDLFGNPFEPKMFDMKPPIFNIRISESPPPTYANALKESEVNDIKVINEYEDSLTLSKDLLFMKNTDKVHSLMRDWFPTKFCYGLMEVAPLHFTYASSSDSTYILPLSEHKDTTKLMRAAKAAHYQQDKCGSIASMFSSYSNEIFEHLAQILNLPIQGSNSKTRKVDESSKNKYLHHDMAFSCNDSINTNIDHKPPSLSKFFTVPPQQVLCMDRLHSGGRRYFTLDFGSPVMLTDVLIPPSIDFASLMIDVSLKSDFINSRRIAVSTDISTRFLIIGDLQPAPICRFVKITVIGRFGTTTIRCRTLIGNFYGHVLMDYNDEPKAQFDVVQSNQLASVFEEVNCKYRLACSKLKGLLQPLLKNGSSMDIDEDLSNVTSTNSKTKCQNYTKIITYYDEAMQYKYQLNILKNIFSKYKMTDLDHANLYDESNIKVDVCLDKLVNLSELIIGLLWYFGDFNSIEIDIATCEQLFNAYCLSEHLQTQMLIVNFLIHFCSRKEYWGKFIAELLLKIFSSNNRNKNYSDDRIFILLCYMGSRSPDRSEFFDAIFKQLSSLILPLTTTNTIFSPINTKIDLMQLEWYLLFISVQFDFIYSSNNWKWLSNNTTKKSETKDFTSLESVVGNNAENLYSVAGTSQGFMINYKPKKKSKVQNPFMQIPPNTNSCDATNAYLLSLSQKSSNDMKKSLIDLKKDSKNIPSEHDVLNLFNNKNLIQPNSDLVQLLNYYQSNRHNGTVEDIQLDKTSAFIALRALMTLLVNVDISCHADLIPIVCKAISQIAHCSQTEISRFVTKRELKILLEIFLRSSNANNNWMRYSIMILIFDLLETTFTDSLPFLNEYQNVVTNRKNNFTQVQLLPGTNNGIIPTPPLSSYYSLINISKTIDDRISMGLEILTEYHLRKLSADKAGTLFSSFDKIKISPKNNNENNVKKDRISWWTQDMLNKWQIECCNTRSNIVPEILDEIIQGLSEKSSSYFDYLLHIWQLIAYNFQVTKLQSSSYEAIIQYCVNNSCNINIRTWNHVFIIFNNMKMNEKWFLVENPNFFIMLQQLLSKCDLNMQRTVSIRLQESFNLCLNSMKNQIESNHMILQQQILLQNNCLNLLNYLIEPNSGPFSQQIGPINLQIEFLNFMIMYFDVTIEKYWTINKESIFQIIYNISQLLLNQMNHKSAVYCLSLGTVPEDNLKCNTFIDMNIPDSIPLSIKGLLFLMMFIINNILVRLIDKRDDSFSNFDHNPSTPSSINIFLSELLDNESIVCNFLTILSQSTTTNLHHLMNVNNESFSTTNLRKQMHTIEDGIYRFIIILLTYNLEPMKIINPIMKILQNTEKISEVFVFLLQNVFKNEELITLFLNNGGSEILSRGIMKSVQNMTKDHRGCVSSMIQQLVEPNEFLECPTEASKQKVIQEVFDMKRGLMNFAPLSTISCPLASNSQQPDILINSSVPPNRRARCAQWDYLFQSGQSYVDIFITLPYAVQVNEVQIQPFLSNLASCPSSVALEISKYASDEYVPITQPLQTEGMKFIRLFLPIPEVVTKLVLRFYKPCDSDHLTLSHIRILGTTAFQNFSAKQTADTENFGWIRAFHNLVNILRPKSEHFRLPEKFNIDEVLGAYCHLLLSPINILASDLAKIEETLLSICLHDETNGLKLLNLILSGHKMNLNDEINDNSQDNSFLIPVMFNSMSKYSVCKMLYDMADYYHHKNAMFLNRVKILLKWLENLTLYVTSNENLMVDNCATYIYCISQILWPPNDEAVDSELQAAISSNIMPKLAEWSMKLTDLNKTIKQAVNSVLCSICAIDSNNFVTILNYLNFVQSVSEQQSSSTSTQSYLSIDQTLCLTESQLEMLTMLLQSPKCIKIFIDSGLSTALINAVSGFCMKSSTLPMSNTTMVTAILKLFSNLCYWKEIQNWLGTKGAIFWKLLLERLCCRSTRNVHVNLDSESYTQLEDEYIHFISKCCLLNSKNQQLLAQTLCDVISIHNKSSNTINNSPVKSNKHYLTAFTRRIITQILLESEKITVFIYSNEMVTKNDIYSNVNVICHPEFMKTLYTECLQLSVNCTLKDLLTFHISFGVYSKKINCGSNANTNNDTGNDNVPLGPNKKRPIISTNLWDLTTALKSNAFHKKLKNSECFTLQNYNSLFNAESGDTDIEQQSDFIKFESSDDCDLDDEDDDEEDDFDDDIQVVWCANSQKKTDDLSTTSQLYNGPEESKTKQSTILQGQSSLNSHNYEYIIKCLDLPNIERLPLNLTLGQVYKMIESTNEEPQNLCIRLYVVKNDSKKDTEKMETDTINPNEIPVTVPTTTLQAFSSIGGLAILSQYLTVENDNFNKKLSSDVFMKPIKYCRSNTYQMNNNKDNNKDGNTTGFNEATIFDGLKYLQTQTTNMIYGLSMQPLNSVVMNSYNTLRATSTPIELKNFNNEIPSKETSTSSLEIPNYSLIMFSLCLRLPSYANMLLTDMKKACYLLRILLGVTDNEDGDEIVDLKIAASLPLLPFEVLRRLLDSTPLDINSSRILRNTCVSLGITDLIINCLVHFLNQKSTNEKKFIPPFTNNNINNEKHNGDKNNYWAKGTGFGTGSTQQTWNVEMSLIKQKNEEKQMSVLLNLLSSYMNPGDNYPANNAIFVFNEYLSDDFINAFCESSILSTLSTYLRNDSVLDMSRHILLYMSIFKLLRAVSMNEKMVKLLITDYVDRRKYLILFLLEKMNSCLKNYESKLLLNKQDVNVKKSKLSLASSDKQTSCDENVSCLIPNLSETIRIMTWAINCFQDKPISMEIATFSDCSSLKNVYVSNDLSPQELYVKIMEKLQFGSHEMIVAGQDSENNYMFTVSYHYESLVRLAGNQTRPSRVKRLAQEAVTLSNSLPLSYNSTVFVRTDIDRLDIMKVLITGPSDTPYSNGCFEFDVYFPLDYPKVPMSINLETTGYHSVRFNPNLYNDGKVCLSILNTWHGRPEEKWNSKTSSFLQVLVSIQSLILVSEPYFNEPGYERSRGTHHGDQSSKDYNINIYQSTVRWAMLEHLINPNPCFKDIIETHFYLKRNEIFKQLDDWYKELETFYNEKEKEPTENSSNSGTNNRINIKTITISQVEHFKKTCQEVKNAIKKLNNPLLALGVNFVEAPVYDEMIDLTSIDEKELLKEFSDCDKTEDQIEKNANQDQVQDQDQIFNDSLSNKNDDKMDVEINL